MSNAASRDAPPGSYAANHTAGTLAADAAVVVLRAQTLEQRDRLRERLHALHRPVGHVHRRLPAARDSGDIGALGHEITNQLVVAAGRGVVERRVAVVVARVDVGAKL